MTRQRTLNHQMLHIDGTGTFAGNDPDTFNDDTYLQNAATLEIGSGGSLDLQGDQDIHNGGGTGTNSVHVLSGGTLSRSSGSQPALITTRARQRRHRERGRRLDARQPRAQPAGRQRDADLERPVQRRAGRGARRSAPAARTRSTERSFAGAGTIHDQPAARSTPRAQHGRGRRHSSRSTDSTLANTGTLTVNGTLDWGTLDDLRRRDDHASPPPAR